MSHSVPPASAADLGDADRIAGPDRASRDRPRTDPTAIPPALSGSPAPTVSVPPPGPSVPALPKPVSGLNQAQMNNAKAIVEAGRKLNVPRRAHVVAIITALQESNLRVLANPTVPESMRKLHEGSASDHDSLGLFQQRPSQGWGTVTQLMSPGESSRLFYGKLLKLKGWENLPVGDAAQKVQRSAFPGAYTKHQARAEQIVDALV
jgi:hypothetical protein